MADRLASGSDAFEEISGVAVRVVNMRIPGSQRIVQDGAGVGYNPVSIDSDATLCTHEAGPALVPDIFPRVCCGVNHDTIGIMVVNHGGFRTAALIFILHLDRCCHIRIHRPLDDIIVVWGPVHIPNETA